MTTELRIDVYIYMPVYIYIYTHTLTRYLATAVLLLISPVEFSWDLTWIVPDIQNLIRLKNIPVYELWRTF